MHNQILLIMISIIVAMSRNRVIGKDNQLVWHLPADLRHFKETTMGRPVIMGRKTFESMGKSLPGRTNVVVTRQEGFKAKDCIVAPSVGQALEMVSGEPEIFIAGGGEIYSQSLPLTERMYITVIDNEFVGDTFFPEFPEKEWKLVEEKEHRADERNRYSMVFQTWDRVRA
jgi:dihydrofolate reductase